MATGIVGGNTYKFRLRARNIHGWSPASSELTAIASGPPDPPAAPTTSLSSLNVRIQWVPPNDNYGGITAYEISIQDSTGTPQVNTVYCDGSSEPVFSQRFCLVPMTALRTTYSLGLGATVAARVRALGENGWGGWSPASTGTTVETEPGQMAQPTEGAGTTEAQIEVVWTALTGLAGTGGSATTSYHLEWHAGGTNPTATWSTLAGFVSSYTLTSFVVTTGITPGALFTFRVRARNVWGWGAYSSEASITASRAPAQPSAPTTTLDATTGALIISWTAPDNRGAAITSYSVQVSDASGTTWPVDAACASSTSLSGSIWSCRIPMPTLTAGPYSYTRGTLIKARLTATNAKGTSAVSAANTAGAVAKTLPVAPAAPTRNSATSPLQVVVDWIALSTDADTGGLPITSYRLQYDAGTGQAPGGASWAVLVGDPTPSTATTYTATGAGVITAGQNYQLRVSARNAIGWGPWSTITSVSASSAPGQMSPVTTSIPVGLSVVRIAWAAPADNNQPISSYEILIREQGGATFSASAACDGANAGVLAAAYCDVPLATLRAAPYNLVFGDLVVAKARAVNSHGPGTYSQPNTVGASI